MLTDILTGYASQFICISNERVMFNSGSSISFGSLIVLKIKFGKCSVEVWLRKIWLGGDNLVEILY